MNPSTLILYRDHGKNRRYRWTEKAANGEPVARSAQGKGYASATNRNKGLMAAARGFGLHLTAWHMPKRGEEIRLIATGTTTARRPLLLKMLPAFGCEKVSLIIRNDDDK